MEVYEMIHDFFNISQVKWGKTEDMNRKMLQKIINLLHPLPSILKDKAVNTLEILEKNVSTRVKQT